MYFPKYPRYQQLPQSNRNEKKIQLLNLLDSIMDSLIRDAPVSEPRDNNLITSVY